MKNPKLVTAIFVTGIISTVHSAAIGKLEDKFNPTRTSRSNLLHGTTAQESDGNFLNSSVVNNLKEDGRTEILGGYRPLYPPYFLLMTPSAANLKVYLDDEYYTRGTELERTSVGSENYEPVDNTNVRSPLVETISTDFLSPEKNTDRFDEDRSSFTDVRNYDATSGNVAILSVSGGWTDLGKLKTDHKVTFITY